MQQELTLNNELVMTVPDGFRILTKEEPAQMRMIEEGEGVCLSDPARHMIVSIGWKHAGFLTAHLADMKAAVKSMEAKTAKPMKPYGYRRNGFREVPVGTWTAEGFDYDYTAQEIAMTGMSCLMKEGRSIYYFHVYVRTLRKEESFALWEDMLRTVRRK